jgi:hypothetical protein
MKNMYWLIVITVLLQLQVNGQVRWDGGGGDNQWNNAANWSSDQLPSASDDIILDNQSAGGSYQVILPAGQTSVTVNSIQILPASGLKIELILPKENTVAPALLITGGATGLVAEKGAVIRNSSGASSGDAIVINNGFRLANGARYIHNTPRGNASIIDQLINEPGTEDGIFEFDVPGSAGYTISLTGNTFGTLIFSASAGSKSYSGNGTSRLQINGDLIVNQGATVTSTLTADILIGGDLAIDGTINFNPPSAGSTSRSLQFAGSPCIIKGNGNIQMNGNFNGFRILSLAVCKLERSVTLSNTGNNFQVVNGGFLATGMHSISGNGRFTLEDNASISFGAAVGIQQLFQSGNICTASRNLSPDASYIFNGVGVQSTGNSFPASVKNLILDKSDGQLVLNHDLEITNHLSLSSGIILTDANAKLFLKDVTITSPANQYNLQNGGWEKSYISGPVNIELNNPGKWVVPIGKGNYFAPVMLDKINGGRSIFTVEYFSSPFANAYPVQNTTLHHVSELEYWDINAPENSSSDEVNIGLSWRPYSAVAADQNERQALRLAYLNQSNQAFQWQRLGADPEINGSNEFGFITSNQSTVPAGIFSLASAAVFNILPFRSIELYAKENISGIDLNWSVDADEKHLIFYIEKSRDGRSFQPIDTVQASGRNRHAQYSYTDNSPFHGLNWYRVAVRVNTDTSFYSSIVTAKYKSRPEIKLYPNPAVKEISIFFPQLSSRTECRIVRNNGSAVVKKVFIHENNNRINIDDLPSGQYFVLLFTEKNGLIALPFLKY